MGGGTYSGETHKKKATERASRGETAMRSTAQHQSGKTVTDWPDPRKKAYFESCDIDGKPSLPMIVCTDVTNSVADYLKAIFESTPRLHGLLTDAAGSRYTKNYQLQISFAGVGDKQDASDRYPLQFGEFEADNRMDEVIRGIVQEKGGGDLPEDYYLILYMARYHTRLDIVKRGLKGYLFLIADDESHDPFLPEVASSVVGASRLTQSVSVKTLAESVMEWYHLFYLQVNDLRQAKRYWTKTIGAERFVTLVSPQYIAETIAVITGLTEGVVSLQQAEHDLVAVNGLDRQTAKAIVASVSHIPIAAQAELDGYASVYGDTSRPVDADVDPLKPGDDGWL